MRMRLLLVAALMSVAQTTMAQSVFRANPPVVAPYSRPALSPYLNLLRGGDPAANYYLGVLTEYDRRFQQSRIPVVAEMPRLDPFVDDRADMDLPDKRLPPTGHPSGFMIYNSYYNMPNQRSFIPYNPQGGRQMR
jgi:hypothetical protein